MTALEIRELLGRVDARQLREDAGIRIITVARAFGVSRHRVAVWETGRWQPRGEAGIRWVRLVAGLARHAEVHVDD